MNKSSIFMAIALAWPMAVAATTDADYHEGLAAFDRGDYELAAMHWKSLADAGDRESQFRLAHMYAHGEIGQDDAEALRYYTMSAEQGHPRAQNNLALLYQEGRGAERDLERAVLWYRRAADRGLAVAQGNLGRMYELGRGVTADAAEAARWYRRAADQDHANSQYWLALLHDEGRGVEADAGKAAKWYRRAAKEDHGPAQAALGKMYAIGRGVERDPEKARKWLGRASGKGIVVSLPEAESPPPRVAKPARKAPQPPVEPELPADSREAIERADATPPTPPVEPEEQPDPPSGTPGALDLVTATELLDFPQLRAVAEAAQGGDVDAMYTLAGMYGSGNGAPQSLQDSARWYRAAAVRGHETAIYKTALVHLHGRGVARKDYAEAYKWLVIAAELGIGDAEKWRKRVFKKMTDDEKEQAAASIAAWRAEQP